MRTYSQVAPQFWTGETGRFLRAGGSDCLLVGAYLVTCPNSNMIGLYYLPMPTLVHETALAREIVMKALRRGSEGGFAFYDDASETVWVPEMARFQIGKEMKANDNRRPAVLREALSYCKSPFYADFLRRYNGPFNLRLEAPPKPLRSPSEAPPKGLLTGTGEGTGEKEPPTVGADAPTPDAKKLSPQQEAVERAWEIFDRFDATRPPPGVITSWRKELKGDTGWLCRVLEEQGPRGYLSKGEPYLFKVVCNAAAGNGKPVQAGPPTAQIARRPTRFDVPRGNQLPFGVLKPREMSPRELARAEAEITRMEAAGMFKQSKEKTNAAISSAETVSGRGEPVPGDEP